MATKQTKTTATGKKRGRPPKAQPKPEINKSWSIVLFGVGAVLLALTWIRGAAAWNVLSDGLFGLCGVATYFIAPYVFYLAVLIAAGRPFLAKLWEGALVLLFISACALIFSAAVPGDGMKWWQFVASLGSAGVKHQGGGLIAAIIGWPLLALCGRPAANVIIIVLIAVFVMLFTNTTPVDIYLFFQQKFGAARERVSAYEDSAAEAREQRLAERGESGFDAGAFGKAKKKRSAAIDIPLESGNMDFDAEVEGPTDYGSVEMPAGTDMSAPPAGSTGFAFDVALESTPAPSAAGPAVAELAPDIEAMIKKAVAPAHAEPPAAEAGAKPAAPVKTAIDPVTGQTMLTPGAPGQNAYNYPPLSLFEKSKGGRAGGDSAELKHNADLLVSTLASFGVETRLLDISCGPSVTRYELQPAAGVKISRITGLADDIALNLAAAGVRIEAPIPGKAAVGIEVPNKHASAVDMYSILSSNAFKSNKSPILIPLGKDIAGNVQVADLAKMPHLLIAGSTGSGKSVCINAIITSIIYRSSPEDVRLVLIDPKVVELSDYNGIPHLLMPVVTEPRKASGALGVQVAEMERRYQLFAQNNVRDIKTYNRLAESEEGLEKLPYIAIVIDELADLMMVCGKEVEDYICRIAQKARAAGMHLVVATQRPSVDVITGLIKANIPSRIAFAVSSQIDSRTILDGAGAEKLLGMGDMLFMPVGANKPLRIQGTYVKDEEISAIIDFVKQDTAAQYNEGMIADMEKLATAERGKGTAAGDGEDSDAHDPMLKAAIETVIEANMASTSLLQRKLKLGYARAARIMDTMEELHIIGAYEGAKPRSVLISRQQFLEMFANADEPSDVAE